MSRDDGWIRNQPTAVCFTVFLPCRWGTDRKLCCVESITRGCQDWRMWLFPVKTILFLKQVPGGRVLSRRSGQVETKRNMLKQTTQPFSPHLHRCSLWCSVELLQYHCLTSDDAEGLSHVTMVVVHPRTGNHILTLTLGTSMLNFQFADVAGLVLSDIQFFFKTTLLHKCTSTIYTYTTLQTTTWQTHITQPADPPTSPPSQPETCKQMDPPANKNKSVNKWTLLYIKNR